MLSYVARAKASLAGHRARHIITDFAPASALRLSQRTGSCTGPRAASRYHAALDWDKWTPLVKSYAAYAIGAALVDTEIQVSDEELVAMNVDKGMMTLVDADRQAEMLAHLSGSPDSREPCLRRQRGQQHDRHCADGRAHLYELQGRRRTMTAISIWPISRQSGVAHGLQISEQDGVTGKCLY